MTSEELKSQPYINLETYRRSGAGVRTPVWFIADGEKLYVRTLANSGKVKRIRNNGSVNIAPCKVDGALLGDWQTAYAREVKDIEIARKVDRMLDRKYGLMKKLFGLAAAIQRRQYTVLEIRLAGQNE